MFLGCPERGNRPDKSQRRDWPAAAVIVPIQRPSVIHEPDLDFARSDTCTVFNLHALSSRSLPLTALFAKVRQATATEPRQQRAHREGNQCHRGGRIHV